MNGILYMTIRHKFFGTKAGNGIRHLFYQIHGSTLKHNRKLHTKNLIQIFTIRILRTKIFKLCSRPFQSTLTIVIFSLLATCKSTTSKWRPILSFKSILTHWTERVRERERNGRHFETFNLWKAININLQWLNGGGLSKRW